MVTLSDTIRRISSEYGFQNRSEGGANSKVSPGYCLQSGLFTMYKLVQEGQVFPYCRENDAPRPRNPTISSENIVIGKRTRSSAHAAHLSTFAVAYISTFATAINPIEARKLHESAKVRLHRNQMPTSTEALVRPRIPSVWQLIQSCHVN